MDWLETRGRLNDGFENEYARGLTVTSYKGLRQVSHGTSTAGYQTFLARFPQARLSVAVLCNTTGTNPGAMAHQVADLFLAGQLREEPARPTVSVSADVLKARACWYADPASGALIRLVLASDGLRANGTSGNTHPTVWQKVEQVTPSAEALKEYEGRFMSPELEVTYRLYVDTGKLWWRLHGKSPQELKPADRDAFESDGNAVRFTRDAAGRVDGLTVYADRVWHCGSTGWRAEQAGGPLPDSLALLRNGDGFCYREGSVPPVTALPARGPTDAEVAELADAPA